MSIIRELEYSVNYGVVPTPYINHTPHNAIVVHRVRRPKPRENLPEGTTMGLKLWLRQHLRNPYPTANEKKSLALRYNLSLTQINNWFINARRRYLKVIAQDVLVDHLNNSRDLYFATPLSPVFEVEGTSIQSASPPSECRSFTLATNKLRIEYLLNQ
jgi:hypothetical protein